MISAGPTTILLFRLSMPHRLLSGLEVSVVTWSGYLASTGGRQPHGTNSSGRVRLDSRPRGLGVGFLNLPVLVDAAGSANPPPASGTAASTTPTLLAILTIRLFNAVTAFPEVAEDLLPA